METPKQEQREIIMEEVIKVLSENIDETPDKVYLILNTDKPGKRVLYAKLLKFAKENELKSLIRNKYRKRKELPDPSKPANAEVNRLTKQFKVRVSEEMKEDIEIASQELGITMSQWAIDAFNEKLQNSR